jgi:hypothetical protein
LITLDVAGIDTAVTVVADSQVLETARSQIAGTSAQREVSPCRRTPTVRSCSPRRPRFEIDLFRRTDPSLWFLSSALSGQPQH